MGVGLQTDDHRLSQLRVAFSRLTSTGRRRGAVISANSEGERPGLAATDGHEVATVKFPLVSPEGRPDLVLVVRVVIQTSRRECQSRQVTTQSLGPVEGKPLREDVVAHRDSSRFWKLRKEGLLEFVEIVLKPTRVLRLRYF
jgi:hypothetical protein